MKEWLAEHKFYLVAGTLLVLGGLYYLFIFQPGLSQKQDITGTESLSVKTQTATETKQNEPTKQPEKEVTVVVDVKGEIKLPGVYQSNQNERVIDVIEKAGGLTDNADKSQVNFAAHVQDEMIIYVPAKGEVPPATEILSSQVKNGAKGNTAKININKADENELQNLTGIGPSKAAAIVQYRQDNGPFSTIEDLKKISGIGDKTFEKLKESISVQ